MQFIIPAQPDWYLVDDDEFYTPIVGWFIKVEETDVESNVEPNRSYVLPITTFVHHKGSYYAMKAPNGKYMAADGVTFSTLQELNETATERV